MNGKPPQEIDDEIFEYTALPPEGVGVSVKVRAEGPIRFTLIDPDKRTAPDTGSDAVTTARNSDARPVAGRGRGVRGISDLREQIVRVWRKRVAMRTLTCRSYKANVGKDLLPHDDAAPARKVEAIGVGKGARTAAL